MENGLPCTVTKLTHWFFKKSCFFEEDEVELVGRLLFKLPVLEFARFESFSLLDSSFARRFRSLSCIHPGVSTTNSTKDSFHVRPEKKIIIFQIHVFY